jgi:hypothetical protein
MRIALSTRSTLLRRPRALPYPFNSAYTENIKQNAWAVDQGPDSWYAVPAVPRSKSRHGRRPTDRPAIVLPSVLTRCDDSTSIRAEKLLCQDRANRLSAQFWRESAPSEGPISRAGACRPALFVAVPKFQTASRVGHAGGSDPFMLGPDCPGAWADSWRLSTAGTISLHFHRERAIVIAIAKCLIDHCDPWRLPSGGTFGVGAAASSWKTAHSARGTRSRCDSSVRSGFHPYYRVPACLPVLVDR